MSAREAEVLTLLGKHLTHAEIAAELVVSVRTVESHVASLRRKLGIPGHRDLVRYAAARHQHAAGSAHEASSGVHANVPMCATRFGRIGW